jgi:hypothetical protein
MSLRAATVLLAGSAAASPAVKYQTARPGAVKNDAIILLVTIPWD